ncbi:MAG TPA: c-type cytochrome domain-containing protein, partial [Tepidisphaeraceae bacterium]|nr:c-type cytochrome domain-containing protein [Tepidisphaeraceae bacterium]
MQSRGRQIGLVTIGCVALALGGWCAGRVDASAYATVDYDRQVLPILSDNCYKCHGPDEGARKAKLRLDTKDGAFGVIKGKNIIAPGNPAGSELIRRISSSDPDVNMPPPKSGRKLTAEQIATIKAWVEQGAKWERHWAFVPPVKREPAA